MSDKFSIVISANNQSHQSFVQLTQDAKSAGLAVEQMSTKSGRSLQDINQRAAAFGVGIGTIIGGVAQAGRAFQNQENQIRALNRAYGDASVDIQKYARDLQQTTTYSDDAARQSAITAATLSRNYSLTADEIQKVITVSADLAAVNGVSLTDATQRVTAAIRGETESAEALGLTMNQQAIDRAGLTLTMSNEEAAHFRLNALLEQSAFAQGAAGDAAETHAGQAKQLLNVLQDQIQAFGAATGVTGEYLSVLSQLALIAPVAGGAIGKLATGVGGLGTLGVGGGVVAADLLSLYLAYDVLTGSPQAGGDFADKFFSTGQIAAATTAQKFTPGSFGDTFFESQKAHGNLVLNQNDMEALIAKMFFGVTSEEDVARIVSPILLKGGFGGPAGFSLTHIPSLAAANYQTPTEYISSQAALAGFVLDPTTGQYLSPSQQLGRRFREYGGYSGMGAGLSAPAIYPGQVSPAARAAAMRPSGAPMEFDPSAIMARAGGIPEGGGSGFLLDAAANADKTTAALKETYGAYYELVTGMTTAGEAASAFKITQDELIENQSVYGQQISEFSQQQNALTAGRDILLERQKEGVTLTKEEQDLLDNYPELYEQVSTATDNATVSSALIAAAYIENMEKSDQYKSSLDETTTSLSGLTDMIGLFILSLEGVPPEVRTKLLLEQDQAMAALLAYQKQLGQTPRDIATTLTVYPNYGSDVLRFIGGGGGQLHGGVVGYGNGGVVIHAGEAGPEFMHFANGGSAWASSDSLYSVPRGTYVTPAPASVGKGGRGGGITINGNVIVMANDARQMEQSIREYAVGSSRG